MYLEILEREKEERMFKRWSSSEQLQFNYSFSKFKEMLEGIKITEEEKKQAEEDVEDMLNFFNNEF